MSGAIRAVWGVYDQSRGIASSPAPITRKPASSLIRPSVVLPR